MLVEGGVVPIRLAVLSSHDKAGLVEFAQLLNREGARLVSTGGTARVLRDSQVPVLDVSSFTHFPEVLGGRLKTLHPLLHGGLLARPTRADDRRDMEENGIRKIDLLYVTLYPFEKTVLSAASTAEDCVENIDIGGPAMIRSAAKNFQHTVVVVDPEDIVLVEQDLRKYCGVSLETRRKLACKAFARTAHYDALIAQWFSREAQPSGYPKWFTQAGTLQKRLRYGENGHQSAAAYRTPFDSENGGVLGSEQAQGKSLSYNNIGDADAALELVSEFDPDLSAACCIIKHGSPCGVSLGETILQAYTGARACDPVSAFGGVVAFNRFFDDEEAAGRILDVFVEIVIVPGASQEVVRLFKKKPNLRLLIVDQLLDPRRKKNVVRTVSGGLLVQSRDNEVVRRESLRVVTKRAPIESEVDDMLFALRVVKHARSNAVVYAREGQTLGVGAGQMSRVDATKIATAKASSFSTARTARPLAGAVMASDAFFPFPDSVLEAARSGCVGIIQPGGSIRDAEVVEAADDEGISMVFTGTRHFRH